MLISLGIAFISSKFKRVHHFLEFFLVLFSNPFVDFSRSSFYFTETRESNISTVIVRNQYVNPAP